MAFSQSNQNNFRITTRNSKSFISSKIGHYLLGQSIGKGGFATVHRAVDIYTKVQLAVKVIDLERMTEKQKLSLKREISIHSKLNHPNIPKLYEVIEKNQTIYMIMELAEGVQLFEYISSKGPLQQRQAVKVFQQVCLTVKYLHDQGIAHRDIKTENIMIDSSFKVKLLDFGLSKNFQIGQNVFNHTFCGSPSYCSPQIIEKKTYSTQLVDIWCLGVTLFVMLEAFLPFDDFNDGAREENICNFDWHATNYSSDKAVEVFNLIFVPCSKRIKIGELLCCDLFSKLCFEKGDKLDEKRIIQPSVQNRLNLQYTSKISGWLNKAQEEVETEISNQKFGDSFALYRYLLVKSDHENKSNKIKTDEARIYLPSNKRYLRVSSEMSDKNMLTPYKKKSKAFSIHHDDIKITGLQKSLKSKIHSSLICEKQQIMNSVKNNKNKIKNKIVANSFRINKDNFQKLNSYSEALVIKNYPRLLK